jgi:hypothetical protein
MGVVDGDRKKPPEAPVSVVVNGAFQESDTHGVRDIFRVPLAQAALACQADQEWEVSTNECLGGLPVTSTKVGEQGSRCRIH